MHTFKKICIVNSTPNFVTSNPTQAKGVNFFFKVSVVNNERVIMKKNYKMKKSTNGPPFESFSREK